KPPYRVLTATSTVLVPCAAGAVAVIEVSEFTVKEVAATPPKDTWFAPVNPEPVMVTLVPPALDPRAGLIAVTLGTGATKVNWSAVTAAEGPLSVVTRTSTGPGVLAGLVTVNCVEELMVMVLAATPPKATLTRPVKLVPVMTTLVPPAVVPDVTL